MTGTREGLLTLWAGGSTLGSGADISLFGEDVTTEEAKVRRTMFVAATVGDVRFCELSIVVAARMVIGVRDELDRQEAREVRGVREVAVIDRRERAGQDILVVYRMAGRVAESGSDSCSYIHRAKNICTPASRKGLTI